MKNFTGLVTLRALLGAFEATSQPSFVLLSSIWYKREEQAGTVIFWYVQFYRHPPQNVLGTILMRYQVHDERLSTDDRQSSSIWVLIRTRDWSYRIVAGTFHDIRHHHRLLGRFRHLVDA